MQNMITISNDSSEVSKIEATIQNDNLTIQEQIRTLQQTIKKLKNDMYNSNKNESINYGSDNNKCNSNNEDKFKFSFNDVKGKCEEKDKEKATVYSNSNNKKHFYQENMNKIRKEKQLLAEMTQFKRDLTTNKDNSYFKRKLIENEDNNYNNNININNDMKTITSNSNYNYNENNSNNINNNNINIINSPTNSVPFSLESITNSDEIETLLSLHRNTPKQTCNVIQPINPQGSMHNNNRNNNNVNPNLISTNQNPMLFIEDLSHTIKEPKSSSIRSYRTSSIPNKHSTKHANISTYKANVVSSEINTNRNVHKRNKSFMFKTHNTSNSSMRINNNNNISPFKIKPNHNISSYNSKYNYNKTVQTYLNEISKLKSEVSRLQKENALLKEELSSEQTQHSHYRQLTEDMINYYNNTKLKKQKHFYSK